MKFWIVTATGEGAAAWTAAVVVAAGGVVTEVVTSAAVVAGTWVVGGRVATVVDTGVAWVVDGGGLYSGPEQPANRTASRTAVPKIAYLVREIGMLTGIPHGMITVNI
jgi:hypothetical protein